MNLKKHYESLWYKALQKFKNDAFEYDHMVNSKNDERFGVSLIARPSADVKEKVQQMLADLRKAEPEQYYYPSSDIHITVLSIISCYQGFSIKNIHPQSYINVIENALLNKKAFDIHFKGITASPSCILLQGYPQNETLQHIRSKLREYFSTAGLHESIDKRYSIITAHSTVVRFKKRITNSADFITLIKKYRDVDFGVSHINELELVCNNWYQQKNKSCLLHSFWLPE